jgi:hypothetical protein
MPTAYFNRFTLELPQDAVYACSQAGSVDEDVAYWGPKVKSLNPSVRPEDIRAELKEYGAWDAEELTDEAANWERITWIAACNIKEEE